MARSYTGVARLVTEGGRDIGEVDVQIQDGGRRGWEGSLWTPGRHMLHYLADTDQLTCVLRLPSGRSGRIHIQRGSVAPGRTITFVGIGDPPFGDNRPRREG